MSNQNLKRPKKLVVCCDGTWMNSDNGWVKGGLFENGHLQVPSNVTRIARAILPEDSSQHPQIVYYQAGLGSSWSLTDHIIGGGAGAGISENIREAYGFLATNYLPGDSVFLLGFSRGAFTARSIGGLIGAFGLLEKDKDGMRFFYDVFEDWENTGVEGYKVRLEESCKKFQIEAKPEDTADYLKQYRKKLLELRLTKEVEIEATGVWDTVGSLGIPLQPWLQKIMSRTAIHEYKFLDTSISDKVKHTFHALALDEHRAAFSPTLWEQPQDFGTIVKQVWFPGVHTNVGGGYDDTSTADLTLAWMMDQLREWIEFNPNYINQQYELNQSWHQERHKEWHWGLGELHNSNKFPTSLGGKMDRTPMLYHQTWYDSGLPKDTMLQNTEEQIHSSVRARMRYGGTNYDGSPYASKALAEWHLEDGHAFQDNAAKAQGQGIKWTYIGRNPDGRGPDGQPKQMKEADMGPFERALLERDPDMAVKIVGKSQTNGRTSARL